MKAGFAFRQRVPGTTPFPLLALLAFVCFLSIASQAQTNCEDGNGLLDFAPPKTLSVEEVIRKFGAAEAETKTARLHCRFIER
jgi:hypothetical protein